MSRVDPSKLPRCDKLDGSTLRIAPSYTEAGRFCEANCLTITDGERTAIYVPSRTLEQGAGEWKAGDTVTIHATAVHPFSPEAKAAFAEQVTLPAPGASWTEEQIERAWNAARDAVVEVLARHGYDLPGIADLCGIAATRAALASLNATPGAQAATNSDALAMRRILDDPLASFGSSATLSPPAQAHVGGVGAGSVSLDERASLARSIDEQLYDYKRRAGFDAHDDDEWTVTLTAREWRRVEAVLCNSSAAPAQPEAAEMPGREAIARIIEPEAFTDEAKEHIAFCEEREVHDDNYLGVEYARDRDGALAKADAILALLSPSAKESDHG